jgi:hypothetical protein
MRSLFGHTRATQLPGLLLVLSTVLLVIYGLFAAGLQTAPVLVDKHLADKRTDICTPEYVEGIDPEFISENGCPSVVQALVTFDKVDVTGAKQASLRIRLFPDGDQGMSLENGGVLFGGTLLSFDGTGQTNYYLNADEWAQAQTATVPLKNMAALSGYPFDKYDGNFSMLLQSTETGETLPLWLTASPTEVPGYSVTLKKVPQPEDMGNIVSANTVGYGKLDFHIERSTSDVFQVLLLMFVLLIGAASAALTTWYIVRGHRPPSLGILAWLATYLFSLIQVRNQFPGSPPLGLNLDRFFTFPAIALVLVLILITAWAWLRRDDWDMGNNDDDKTVDVPERVG